MVSSRVSAPPWNIDRTPFYLAPHPPPPPKILNLSESIWDFIGIFNAGTRKSVSKLSGLRWFLLFEDLYNGEVSFYKQIKLTKNRFET